MQRRNEPSDCPVLDYAEKVLNGDFIAGELVKLACQRHINDLEKSESDQDYPYYFDQELAQHAIDFYSFLKHSKGEWAGQAFRLEPWQKFIVGSIFGWMRKSDDTRRFRTAYNEIPRKNGKSTLAAGIGNYMTIADGEYGAEVYSAATKKDQAKITFDEAAKMVKASPDLLKRVRAYKSNLHVIATGSKFEPLGADADSLDGLNVHCAIVDEFHAHKTSELWDVLETATGARREPLMFSITTAGFNQHGPCYQYRDYAIKVLKGIADDVGANTFFTYIATIDEGDNWQDPTVWAKANPNLGVSAKFDDLIRKADKAKQIPSAMVNFLIKHLNVWVNAAVKWMPLHKWDESAGEIDIKSLKGRRCYGGLDLSSKTDITALVLLFPPEEPGGEYIILPYFWIPEDDMQDKEDRDKVPYSNWVKQGTVFSTPGNVIDYRFIRKTINELSQVYKIQEIAFDSWNATQMSLELSDDGFTMVELPQNLRNLSEATKELEALVLSKRFIHGGNPVLRWMADNVVIRMDANDNIAPDKKKSTARIDGIAATINAIARSIVHRDKISVYEERGLRKL